VHAIRQRDGALASPVSCAGVLLMRAGGRCQRVGDRTRPGEGLVPLRAFAGSGLAADDRLLETVAHRHRRQQRRLRLTLHRERAGHGGQVPCQQVDGLGGGVKRRECLTGHPGGIAESGAHLSGRLRAVAYLDETGRRASRAPTRFPLSTVET